MSSVVVLCGCPCLPSWRIFMKVVIGDHLGATAVWHVEPLEFVILAPMGSLFVVERGAAGYDCRDPCMSHGSCSVTTPLLSGV